MALTSSSDQKFEFECVMSHDTFAITSGPHFIELVFSDNLPFNDNYRDNLPFNDNYRDNLPFNDNYHGNIASQPIKGKDFTLLIIEWQVVTDDKFYEMGLYEISSADGSRH